MAFASAQEIVDAVREGRIHGNFPDLAHAQLLLDAELRKALDNRQNCKDYRPWDIVDMRKVLDPNKPWIGFEFETGYDNKDDYRKYIHCLWGMQYVAIDREGTGNYPVEVAFPPQEVDKLDTGYFLTAARFVRDHGLVPALNPTTFTRRDVSIHAGISSPALRAMGDRRQYDLAHKLDRLLLSLTNEQRKKTCGRSELHWGGANGRNGYLEIKAFRAIPNVEYMEQVVAVSKQIVKLMDYIIKNGDCDMCNYAVFTFLNSDKDI